AGFSSRRSRFTLAAAVAVLLTATFVAASGGRASVRSRASVGAEENLTEGPARNHSPPPLAGASTLSAKDRLEVLEQVWKQVNDKYYDPRFHGVDWKAVLERYQPRVEIIGSDSEFYTLVSRMVGELHDAHTRFNTPLERQDRRRHERVSPGLTLDEVEGKPVVLSVTPGSGAARNGITPGMIVTSIDGLTVSEKMAKLKPDIAGSSTTRAERLRLFHKLLAGDPGTVIHLGLRREDGRRLNAAVTMNIEPDAPMVKSKWVAPGYGYMTLNLWETPIHDQFKSSLEQFKNAKGLILDLRGNPGGRVTEVLKVADYLLSNRTSFGHFVTRSGKQIPLYAGGQAKAIYTGPLAIIVNEGSGSGSEMFSGVMQESGRAVVIGRQSCGCLLGISEFKKVKGDGEIAVSELGYVSPKGKAIEGTGVIPDDVVPLTLADVRGNRDTAIQEAKRALASETNTRVSTH
ncbi:MAG TPA: S41 family peptidase, partial [Blastocatellia bacterium]|nr:S41 family peptidase [Blastocatellia bacterium]